MSTLDLNDAKLIEKPFPHFSSAECLDTVTADTMLRWFENGAPWHRFKDDFYDFEGVNLHDAQLPSELSFLIEEPFLNALRRDFERIFETHLGARAGVAAQRMLAGRDIGVHSDFGPERQTHRLVLQLNRGWTIAQGGILMLFDEEQPERITDQHCFYLPIHRSAVGFAISAGSYHAVSRVREGVRYTLGISFYGDV
jgi:hypothetical protein